MTALYRGLSYPYFFTAAAAPFAARCAPEEAMEAAVELTFAAAATLPEGGSGLAHPSRTMSFCEEKEERAGRDEDSCQ